MQLISLIGGILTLGIISLVKIMEKTFEATQHLRPEHGVNIIYGLFIIIFGIFMYTFIDTYKMKSWKNGLITMWTCFAIFFVVFYVV